MLCGSLLGGIYTWMLITIGFRTVRGEVLDTLGNGIGSIGIALFLLGAAALLGYAWQAAPPVAGVWAAAIAAIGLSGGSGSLLILAGVLALIGRGQYRIWRKAREPQPDVDRLGELLDRVRSRREGK